jgi:hypothetical protein
MWVTMASFDLLLVASILVLEWHYVIDLFGGIIVAAMAIGVTSIGSLYAQGKTAPQALST